MRFNLWINRQTYLIWVTIKGTSSIHEKFDFWTGSNIQHIASMLSYSISISRVLHESALWMVSIWPISADESLVKIHFWMRSVSKKNIHVIASTQQHSYFSPTNCKQNLEEVKVAMSKSSFKFFASLTKVINIGSRSLNVKKSIAILVISKSLSLRNPTWIFTNVWLINGFATQQFWSFWWLLFP